MNPLLSMGLQILYIVGAIGLIVILAGAMLYEIRGLRHQRSQKKRRRRQHISIVIDARTADISQLSTTMSSVKRTRYHPLDIVVLARRSMQKTDATVRWYYPLQSTSEEAIALSAYKRSQRGAQVLYTTAGTMVRHDTLQLANRKFLENESIDKLVLLAEPAAVSLSRFYSHIAYIVHEVTQRSLAGIGVYASKQQTNCIVRRDALYHIGSRLKTDTIAVDSIENKPGYLSALLWGLYMLAAFYILIDYLLYASRMQLFVSVIYVAIATMIIITASSATQTNRGMLLLYAPSAFFLLLASVTYQFIIAAFERLRLNFTSYQLS